MLTAKQSPQWEAKTRPKTTGVREYGVELSAEVFRKLLWITKGKNAANQDSPDRITVSGLAETALREWLGREWPGLQPFWEDYEKADLQAAGYVKDQSV